MSLKEAAWWLICFGSAELEKNGGRFDTLCKDKIAELLP